MTAPVSYVVSDLHLGDRHFCHTQFLAWLDGLPGEAALILNGDIVDNPDRRLCAEHDSVLRRLVAESHSRTVVWVRGNHDRDFVLPDPGGIRFENQWEIGRQLLVVHGHDLDEVMPATAFSRGSSGCFTASWYSPVFPMSTSPASQRSGGSSTAY